MSPLAISPAFLVVGAVVLGAIGFGSGWQVQGWRKDASIAEIKQSRAEEVSRQSQDALNKFTAAAKTINDAARGARLDLSSLGGKLDAIHKDFRNAKPPPLPVDCRPDPIRVRRLTEAAAAIDDAIARSATGGTVSTERPAGSR